MPRSPLHPALQHLSCSNRRALNKCKLWRGAVDAQGYPRQKVKGRSKYAHRLAFEFYWRKLQPGERVYRSCGNRQCVNYFHLVTQKPEREGKRHRPGTAKLAPRKVRAIRAAWAEPDRPTQQELADKHGVSRSAISLVVRGITWPDV